MTDYDKAVSEHLSTAPEELKTYVSGRLFGQNGVPGFPIILCGFKWAHSPEKSNFWSAVNRKDWVRAMSSDFWIEHAGGSRESSGVFEDLRELIQDLESAVSGCTLDSREGEMRSQIEGLSEDEVDELKDAFYKLTLFYQGIY